ncbi:TetR/AcrR family transcriptional regulator [Actinacidiphila sp. bgisy144]|uniref:TetR/AcrR family transcriptional regulator n=1 Tax=unclassified Actinacidiphila TaxID=2995708 RepID=UPI003EBFE7C4
MVPALTHQDAVVTAERVGVLEGDRGGAHGHGQERLRREAIADSAIAIADVEGLEAVTIRRLAKQHNVTPTALYWHFKEKDQLLDGMAERLFANVELPPARGLLAVGSTTERGPGGVPGLPAPPTRRRPSAGRRGSSRPRRASPLPNAPFRCGSATCQGTALQKWAGICSVPSLPWSPRSLDASIRVTKWRAKMPFEQRERRSQPCPPSVPNGGLVCGRTGRLREP